MLLRKWEAVEPGIQDTGNSVTLAKSFIGLPVVGGRRMCTEPERDVKAYPSKTAAYWLVYRLSI